MKKNLEIIENVFSIRIEEKNNKKKSKKSFNVFGISHVRPSNTLQPFFGKMFYFIYFFNIFLLMKNTFYIIS